MYLVQEALAVLCARHSEILLPPAGAAAGVWFAQLGASLHPLKLQVEALAPHLNCLGRWDLVEH